MTDSAYIALNAEMDGFESIEEEQRLEIITRTYNNAISLGDLRTSVLTKKKQYIIGPVHG